ncbi:hypothetical protein ACFV5J_34625 [Streptomyces zaomyceticus]|uniref:hypothetical protein n=1 Tax=Streptomyces zaomyceticus TaxID=68286 RepID=UPI00365F588C
MLDGIAAGEHTERSLILILGLALALAEDRRRDIVKKTKNALESARARGRVGGRRPAVDDDKRRVILARRAEGQSIREIAVAVKVSVGVVHKTLNPAAAPADSYPQGADRYGELLVTSRQLREDRAVSPAGSAKLRVLRREPTGVQALWRVSTRVFWMNSRCRLID